LNLMLELRLVLYSLQFGNSESWVISHPIRNHRPMMITLLFALPQEYAALKRRTGPWRLVARKPFKTFSHKFNQTEITLVETGMGHGRMIEALEWLLNRGHPDLAIAAGFAGSLGSDLAVGDVCLGEAFSCFDSDLHVHIPSRFSHEVVQRLIPFCDEYRVRRVQIITARKPVPKHSLGERFAGTLSVLDMESYFVAQFCREKMIPFISLRAISDGIGDEIDFDLEAISDRGRRVRVCLVLASLLKDPCLLRSYYASWKRSIKASQSLATVLAGLLRFPSAALWALVRGTPFYTQREGGGCERGKSRKC
jgi:nucleoside phosphorylase